MGVRRYYANKDTVIKNAFKSDLLIRATGSNAGMSDVLEVFQIYGQASPSSSEKSRILIQFPISEISTDRTNGLIPASGSTQFWLRMYNAPHAFSVPKNYSLSIVPLSRSWDEGHGKDLESGRDKGYANWIQAATSSTGLTTWTTNGGDYHNIAYTPGSTLPVSYTASFTGGTEDMAVDITSLVEEWVTNGGGTATANNGIIVMLTESVESAVSSSYTKRFFARSSEFFFKRPCIEARSNDSIKDNRGNFYASSSLVSSANNTNTLYFYNYVNGQLTNIPNLTNNLIYVRLYSDDISGSLVVATTDPVTGGLTSTAGVYTASIIVNTTASNLYERWYNSGLTTCFHTGSVIKINNRKNVNNSHYNVPRYIASITNMKPEYSRNEEAYFRVFTRKYDWKPTIYTKATTDVQSDLIENLYYRVKRVSDGLVVTDWGTGSMNHTLCSYDTSGSYFTYDMQFLQSDHMYEIEFLYKKSTYEYTRLNDSFKFRVIE